MPENLENWAVAIGLEKSVFIPISKKGNAKECSKYHTVALISHSSSAMFKIFHARLQQYVNWELPDIQAGFRKGRGTRDQILNICQFTEKAREKHLLLLHWLCLKPSTVWITTNCGKFLRRWEYQTTLPASWEIYMQVKKQQLEPDMEQWTGSKSGKECICHPACLTYMQSASCEMPAEWSTSRNQDCHEK